MKKIDRTALDIFSEMRVEKLKASWTMLSFFDLRGRKKDKLKCVSCFNFSVELCQPAMSYSPSYYNVLVKFIVLQYV